MSTIADYSVFTKAFLASADVDFSKLYTTLTQEGYEKAFAVIPFNIENPLTPREAMNFDWSKLGLNSAGGQVSGPVSSMPLRVSCRDADGNFIGNIVRVQPGERNGSIRFVAKVAVPFFVSSEDVRDPADAPHNTFVLVRTDPSTNIDLPIAVATISKRYNLHRHKVVVSNVENPHEDSFVDPLDDVENANYVSFTINNLNGYTSVDFNPDAYVTYDVFEGVGGIKGLHIAFNSNTGDIILSDSKGNVIDQANLHLDLSANTIIAEGEEGYKYVKTDGNQDVHSAKAFMDPLPNKKDGSYDSAFASSEAVPYDTLKASLVRMKVGEGDEVKVCNGIRVKWTEGNEGGGTPNDEIFCIFLKEGNGSGGAVAGRNYLALNKYHRSGNEWVTVGDPTLFYTAPDAPIEVTGDSGIYLGNPSFSGIDPVYDHDVFVHTVGNSSLADWDECFQLMGFHDGDDIPLGTNLPTLMQRMTSDNQDPIDPEEFIHGEKADNAKKVADQRKLAKDEMVAYNSRRPAFHLNKRDGAIIDHTGLDVRNGRITLGCGRVGENGVFQKVNYGIQMKNLDPNRNLSESLDFTISHHTGAVDFENGHATGLTSSTLLSIEAGSYISGAPTCLILAKVTRKPKDNSIHKDSGDSTQEGSPDPLEGSPVLTPVRMTAGFRVESPYDTSSGLSLTIHDDRENISAVFVDPNNTPIQQVPAIIEVQAIYTHQDTRRETVPAQQMHTYIGSWDYSQTHPVCSFLCNKIEEWMTAIGLADTNPSSDTNPAEGVKLYVVIRVY